MTAEQLSVMATDSTHCAAERAANCPTEASAQASAKRTTNTAETACYATYCATCAGKPSTHSTYSTAGSEAARESPGRSASESLRSDSAFDRCAVCGRT